MDNNKYRVNKLTIVEELILNNINNDFKIHNDYNKDIANLQKEGYIDEFQQLTSNGKNYIYYKSPTLGDTGTNQFKHYFNKNSKQFGLALAMSFLNSNIIQSLSKKTQLFFLESFIKIINENKNKN